MKGGLRHECRSVLFLPNTVFSVILELEVDWLVSNTPGPLRMHVFCTPRMSPRRIQPVAGGFVSGDC